MTAITIILKPRPLIFISAVRISLLFNIMVLLGYQNALATPTLQCETILGYIYVANGTPSVRFKDLVNNKTYGIALKSNDEYPENPLVPSNIEEFLRPGNYVHGEFFVCFLEEIKNINILFPTIKVINSKNVYITHK